MTRDEVWMGRALELAARAVEVGEVPVGAIVVGPSNDVLGQGHDDRQATADPTGHAEVIALREAGHKLGTWNLTGCTLYVTLEPCAMCAGAAILSRVDRVVYGASSDKCGACGSVIDVLAPGLFNHTVQVESGVLADRASEMLSQFFETKRG